MHAAAALARKRDSDLTLVTVLEHGSVMARGEAEQMLARAAAELRQTFEIDVDSHVAEGLPDEQLLRIAAERGARLIVLGAAPAEAQARRLGVVPERLCQLADVPVLLVREAESFSAWSQGQRELRALVGSGLGDASKTALGCVGAWPEVAVTVLQVAWAFGEHYRLGVRGPLTRDHLLPEVEQLLLGELGRWALGVTCRATPKLRVIAGWGRVDFHLAEWVKKLEADLLVVGTHRRNLREPVWQGSVSRSAIHAAGCNVLCVPERYLPPRTVAEPRVVVVPTDLTPLGDRAIAFGASLLDKGGALHVVTVVSDLDEATRAKSAAELASRVPQDLEPRGVACELRVLQGNPAWLAIWQHAARAHADLICMATHSRDSGKGFALGAQTAALLEHAQVPVLLVPQDRES